jgi:hypothetical protein
VVAGLELGLAEPDPELRRQCGRALLRLVERASGLAVSADRVLAAVAREVEGGAGLDPASSSEDALESFAAPIDHPVGPSLEAVFVLLALVLDREPLQLAYRALGSDNPAARGTALEYLDNVLPPAVREQLWPLLGERPARSAAPRPRQQIVDDLSRSLDRRPL